MSETKLKTNLDYFVGDVADPEMKKILTDYIIKVHFQYSETTMRKIQNLTKRLVNLFNDCSPKTLMWDDAIDRIKTLQRPRDGINLLNHLLQSNAFQAENFDSYAKESFRNTLDQKKFTALLDKKITPHNLLTVTRVYKSKVEHRTCVIEAIDTTAKKAIKEELEIASHFTGKSINDFAKKMSAYLKNHPIESLCQDDIINYFNANKNNSASFYTTSKEFFIRYVSSLPIEEQNKRFNLYTVFLLERQTFINQFFEGYVPVPYNIHDPIPEADKWCLLPNGEERKSTQLSKSSIVTIDFSKIINLKARTLAKKYFWYASPNIVTKSKEMIRITEFLNMFFTSPNLNVLKFNECVGAKYKSYILNKYSITETRNGRIYPVLNFLKFIENEKDVFVDKNIYLHIKNNGTLKKGGAGDIPDEEIKILGEYMDSHKFDSPEATMYYVIFNIALATPFRSSQIMHMKIDSIHEGMKKGQYVIALATKATHGEIEERPCPTALKRMIDSYLKYTSAEREKCSDPELKKYIFLIRTRAGVFQVIKNGDFNAYFSKACKKCKLKNYNTKNLRATNLTKTREYVLRNGLSDAATIAITDHRNVDTLNNHYIKEYIADALQASNNVIIGNVDIEGNIVANPDTINTGKDVTVQNECGFCQSDFCSEYGPLPCLMCKNFATTVDRIPYYEAQIRAIDAAIDKCIYREDVEAYTNVKRLHLAYYCALLSLKEEMKNDN